MSSSSSGMVWPQMSAFERQVKKTLITDDYEISNKVLGLGINGKVVECTNKMNGVKYALKVTFYDIIDIGN